MNTLSINQKILIAALIGFLIGASAVLVWDVSRSKTVVRDTGESTSNDKMTEPVVEEEKMAPILLGAKDRIDADDQTAGSLVNILTIQLERAGWVAVHEDNNGKLGNVLGAAWFPSGTSRGGVELLRDTMAGNTYHVVLYNDNDNKIFELGTDALIVDDQQNPVLDTFRTTI